MDGVKIPEKVILKEPAFLEMIIGSAEVFHQECFGLLLGYKAEGVIIVEDAQVVQSARRTPYHVEPVAKRIKRIEKLIRSMGMEYKILGDFHSHTQVGADPARPIPSGEDINDMVPDNLYIIIAINYLKEKEMVWSYSKEEKVLRGTLENFLFEISAYYCFGEDKFKKIDIKCPFASALEPYRHEKK